MKTKGKTALYCRLSMDDGNEGESMSIQGQKALLSKYAKDNGIVDFEYYVDDGYSGTNFNRPAFKQMIADIEDGLISCVVTKDLSRLGRNYLESGAYIEVFFPKHAVRYIAINDGVDSLNSAGLDITPFKNILNEFYSRDIAKKVKTGKKIRAQQGKFMGTWAPFGYIKDPADHNHLIVDEATAPTVRRIYELCIAGMGNNRIGKALCAERLPRPGYYKQEQFGKFFECEDDYYNWSKHIIHGIIRNPLYKGGMWLCTHDKSAFNSKNRGYIELKDREMLEDVHEAIVSKEDWALANELMDRRNKVVRSSSEYENIFRGLLFCADCNNSLSFHADTRPRKDGQPFIMYYLCNTYRRKGADSCASHRVDVGDLERVVLDDIRKQARKAVKNPEAFIRKILRGMGAKGAAELEQIQRQIVKLKHEGEKANQHYIKSYEDFSEGVINKQQFSLISAHYSKTQQETEDRIEELRLQVEKKKSAHGEGTSFAKNLMEYAEIDKLDGTVLNRLIEKIVVTHAERNDGKTFVQPDTRTNLQTITIYYRCVGEL